MDMSDYYNNTIMKSVSHLAGETIEWNTNPQTVNYNTRIDLREYGFDMELNTMKYSYNEKEMLDFAQKKLEYTNFIINNQDIVDAKFNELNPSYIRDSNSYDMFVKPALEYKSQAELSVNIFSKYKIFDSIDIRA